MVDETQRGCDQLVEPQGCKARGRPSVLFRVFTRSIIVIAIAVAGLLFGHDNVTAQVMSSIKGMLGETGAKAVEAMLAGASRPAAGILATILVSERSCSPQLASSYN